MYTISTQTILNNIKKTAFKINGENTMFIDCKTQLIKVSFLYIEIDISIQYHSEQFLPQIALWK